MRNTPRSWLLPAAAILLATASPAQVDTYRKKALKVPFEFLNKTEFGSRTTIRSLLKKKDVQGVCVAFITSSFGGFDESAKEMQALHDAYRKRDVVLIVSVDLSEGSKAVKNTIKELELTVPISPTGVQWTTFQKAAGNRSHNSWPWTFYIDADGKMAEIAQSRPRREQLDGIAKPAAPGEAKDAAAEDDDADAKDAAPASAADQPASRTLAEITVHRPARDGWFFDGSDGFTESLQLTLPLGKDDKPAKDGVDCGRGAEGMELLGRHEAFVHVMAFDRDAHTNIGRQMVDPGSKVQIIKSLRSAYEAKLKLKKPKQNNNARLGGQNATELTFESQCAGMPNYRVTVAVVPRKAKTYIVTLARRADATKVVDKELKAIRKKVRFSR